MLVLLRVEKLNLAGIRGTCERKAVCYGLILVNAAGIHYHVEF